MYIKKFLNTDESKTTLLIRFLLGSVFLFEGIQKFAYSTQRGAGRFESIGFFYPELLDATVGGFEIICGLLGVCRGPYSHRSHTAHLYHDYSTAYNKTNHLVWRGIMGIDTSRFNPLRVPEPDT